MKSVATTSSLLLILVLSVVLLYNTFHLDNQIKNDVPLYILKSPPCESSVSKITETKSAKSTYIDSNIKAVTEELRERYNVRPMLFDVSHPISEEIPTEIAYGNVPDDPNVEYDVTFCSQGTITRWAFMLEIARRWKGPMSIVYYIPEENMTEFNELRANTTLRDNIRVKWFVQTDPTYFPINFLRNQAIENVVTTHFWLADMDVWPTFGSYDAIRKLPREFFADPKNIGIVPVFQNKKLHKCPTFQDCIDFYSVHLPENKTELNDCRRVKKCETFRPGENLHNYYFNEWYNETYKAPLTKLLCFKTDTQEPYIIVRKTNDMPRFDVRFANYAYNKVQWIEHLRYRGYAFWVITDAFAFDIPHPPSTFRKNFFKKMKETHRFPMKKEYDQFLREMRANFTHEAVVGFCRGAKRNQLIVNI